MLRPEDVSVTYEDRPDGDIEYRAEIRLVCSYRVARDRTADPRERSHAAIMVLHGIWQAVYEDHPRRLGEAGRDVYELVAAVDRIPVAERLRAKLKGLALEMTPPERVPLATPRPPRVHCRHCQIVKHEQTERAKTCPLSRTGYHEFRGH